MSLCRSKDSRATSHQSWRFEKNSAERPGAGDPSSNRAARQNFIKPSTLMAGSSAALRPTENRSTSLERSRPLMLTKSLFKSLAALLRHFISVQSILILIGLIK